MQQIQTYYLLDVVMPKKNPFTDTSIKLLPTIVLFGIALLIECNYLSAMIKKRKITSLIYGKDRSRYQHYHRWRDYKIN
jgi:hypothetical protein